MACAEPLMRHTMERQCLQLTVRLQRQTWQAQSARQVGSHEVEVVRHADSHGMVVLFGSHIGHPIIQVWMVFIQDTEAFTA